MRQYAVELHSHTRHSDADFTVADLCKEAVHFGYDGLILTDHNTSSGYPELRQLAEEQGLVTLSGIEWTTYYGHMLVHDAKHLVDWRDARPDTIDEHIQEVKEAGGLVGIAHPYAIGSPMCTGCHWSYEVNRWENVDYIEIWNSTCPDEHFWSWSAYGLWSGLLDGGYRISCSAGRDWHRLEGADQNPAITYVETADTLTQASFRAALEKGAFYITLGPRLKWHVEQEGQTFRMGDTLAEGATILKVEAHSVGLPALEAFTPEAQRVKVIHNGEIYMDMPLGEDRRIALSAELSKGYVRIELWGSIKGKERELLVLSNPIYVKRQVS